MKGENMTFCSSFPEKQATRSALPHHGFSRGFTFRELALAAHVISASNSFLHQQISITGFRVMRAWKLTTGIFGAVALAVSLACSPGLAAPRPGGGAPHAGGGAPHFGGGAPHFGGGAAHFAAPHIAAPHFAPHIAARSFAPHISLGRRGAGIAHFAPRTHVGRIGRPMRGLTGRHVRTASHVRPLTTHATHGIAATQGTTHNVNLANRAARTARLHAPVNHVTGAAASRSFAAHRNFTRVRALRPFLSEPWFRRYHHLGWFGPLFWPYAYGDIFYYALWPYDYWYYDPFWAYGYGDIYEAIFPSYGYASYVRGPSGAARMAALTKSLAQSCSDEAAEVTGWPVDQIQAAVQPNPQQTALLDDLGNAIVKASDVIKSDCPTRVSFTAPDRLADMQQRLTGLVQGIGIVQPPLAKFYDALSDEQKARFNALGAPSGQNAPQQQQAAQNPQSQCGENAIAWPADRIDQAVQPNGAQRAKLDELDAAASEAADTIKAACPSELPATPPDRLAAEGKRLQAILQAVQTIRPKLDDFYASLSNEQKARFNTIGRQLFAAR
jgi:hypothetical protein